MPASAHPTLTDETIETFRRDGVVCLRRSFDEAWVEELRRLVAQDMQRPSVRRIGS